MRNPRYDEYQLKNRHRIAFQTLILTVVLIMANAFLKQQYGIWAAPMLESLVLIYIPALYFSLMSIAKNAYFSKKDPPIFVMCLFGLTVVLGLFTNLPAMLNGTFIFIENGQLADQVGSLFMTTLFGGMLIAILIRKATDKRKDSLED